MTPTPPGPILPLQPQVQDGLDRLALHLHTEFLIRRDRDGKPLIAVFSGKCPLCIDDAYGDKDLEGELRRRSAYLTLPALTLRCFNPECRAGSGSTGERKPGRPNGIPYPAWTKEFSALAEAKLPTLADLAAADTAAPGGRAPDGIKEAVALIASKGAFFRFERESVFVPAEGGEPLNVEGKPFAAFVARLLKAGRRSPRVRDVVDAVIDHAHTKGTRATLEYVTGRTSEGHLLVHLGNGVVLQTSGEKFETVRNGTGDVVFRTERDFLPLSKEELKRAPVMGAGPFGALHEALLDHLPPPAGLLTPEEQRALLLATILSIFLRLCATARPHTLFVGPPGSGKTTIQRVFAVLYFGPEGEVGGGAALDRVPKDLIAGAVYQSLVVRDDVNDLPPGGLDPLCRAATGSKIQVAEFHETLQLGSYRARALFLLSGVNPSWLTRPDLLSRLWILEFGLPPVTTVTEHERVQRALALRPAVWVEVLAALRLVARPLPPRAALSRFDSLERVLFPLMEYAGYGGAFADALRKMPAIAARAASRSDPLLDYILALAESAKDEWLSAAALFDRLSHMLGVMEKEDEPHAATGLVRDPMKLAKALAKLRDQGSTVVRVESRQGRHKQLEWRLTPLIGGGGDGVGGDVPPVNLFDEEEKTLEVDEDENSPPTPSTPPPTNLH